MQIGMNIAVAGIFDIIEDIRNVAPITARRKKFTLLPEIFRSDRSNRFASGTFISADERAKVAMTKKMVGLGNAVSVSFKVDNPIILGKIIITNAEAPRGINSVNQRIIHSARNDKAVTCSLGIASVAGMNR